MADKDTGWRPKGAQETYHGYEVWDLDGSAPGTVNEGEVDPEWKRDPDAPSADGTTDGGTADAETTDGDAVDTGETDTGPELNVDVREGGTDE